MRDIVGRDGRADALTAIVVAGIVLVAGTHCGSGGAATPGDAGDAGFNDEEVGDEMDVAPDWPPPVCPAASGDIQNATCNDQLATGPCVGQIQIDDNAPGPAGGTLIAGTYDLVERIVYTNPGGATGPLGEPTQETFVLAGSGTDFTFDGAVLSAGTTTRQIAAATLSSAQFKLTVTTTCPAAGPSDGGDGGGGAGAPSVYYYTATDTTLTLYRIGAVGPVPASSYLRR